MYNMKNLVDFLNENTNENNILKDFLKYKNKKSWKEYFKYLDEKFNARFVGHDDLDDGQYRIYLPKENIMIDCWPGDDSDSLDDMCDEIYIVDKKEAKSYLDEWGDGYELNKEL